MRKLLLTFALVCLSVSAFASTAISGNLKDYATSSVTNRAFVRFELVNCGTGIPRIIGSSVIPMKSIDIRPNGTGAISGTLYANSEIDCGGATNTRYKVTIFYDGINHFPPQEFIISGASWNLNNASVYTPTTPPAYTPQVVIKNPTGAQTVAQPAGTDFQVSVGSSNRILWDGPVNTTAYNDMRKIANPGNPASDSIRVYGDSSSGNFVCKQSDGSACGISADIASPGSSTFGNINKVIVVDGVKYPYTETGLKSALSDASGSNFVSTEVYLPKGTITTNSQIVVPSNVVLKGAGQQNTKIKAGASFPTNTPLTMLGAGTENTINATRIEDMTLDCNAVANCTAAYTKNANEGSGWRRVTAYNAPKYGFWIDGTHVADTGNPTPGHWFIEFSTTCCYADTAAVYAYNSGLGYISNSTFNNAGGTTGVYVYSDNIANPSMVEVVNVHIEGTGITDAYYVNHSGGNNSTRLSIVNSEQTGSPTNNVHIGSNVSGSIYVYNLHTNGTNSIVNDKTGTTIPVSGDAGHTPLYLFHAGGTGSAVDELYMDNTGLHQVGHGIGAGTIAATTKVTAPSAELQSDGTSKLTVNASQTGGGAFVTHSGAGGLFLQAAANITVQRAGSTIAQVTSTGVSVTGEVAATTGLKPSSSSSDVTFYKTATHASVDLASVASGACTAVTTETITGAALGDSCRVSSGTATADGSYYACNVTATDTVKWSYCNLSGSPIDRASDTYTIRVLR